MSELRRSARDREDRQDKAASSTPSVLRFRGTHVHRVRTGRLETQEAGPGSQPPVPPYKHPSAPLRERLFLPRCALEKGQQVKPGVLPAPALSIHYGKSQPARTTGAPAAPAFLANPAATLINRPAVSKIVLSQ